MPTVADCSPSQCFRTACRHVAVGVALVCAHGSLLAEDAPQRASDTGYGMALYEYHQGNFFQALTRLNVVNAEGGIDGHGDHPLLVEGGLMLAYGMTREAQRLFETLLETSDVSAEARNQAWFYLGKVFWLEKDQAASTEALSKVDGELLEDTDPDLYFEWLYLRGQWLVGQAYFSESSENSETSANSGQVSDILGALPEQSPWRWYLRYNQAVQSLAAGNEQAAVDGLSDLIADALPEDDLPAETADELRALEQQARLSLGRLYLGRENFEQAMAVLNDIPLDGLLSDQALFDFAVAASRQGQNGLALQALETLQNRPLFTPWLQQVPYARAFTIERLEKPQAAFDAYRVAAEHYRDLDQRLATQQSALTEAGLIRALNFVREGEIERAQDQSTATEPRGAEPALGESAMLTDAYGRVRVRPKDFSLAELLSGESFQLALRDLHELYRLDDSLDQWRQQLAAFDVMLDTRRSRREVRIRETRDALAAMKVDGWADRQAEFRRKIEGASASGDATFFMTAEQKSLKQQLDRVEGTLSALPRDESTRAQRETYQRMRAYFDWWVADEYSVNRWAAVKQLRELDEAMETFVSQRALMEQEMASDDRLDQFASRIARQRTELNRVDQQLDLALDQTRQSLMSQVRSELASQRGEIEGYLRASRHAQARLADRLFLGAREPAVQNGADEKEGADE